MHLAAVDGQWLRALQGAPDARRWALVPEDHLTPASAHEAWVPVADAWQDYVARLDEAALMEVHSGMGGPTWHVILHVVNHGTDHRAQILRALHDLGALTFEQELEEYLWTQAPPPLAATKNTC